MNPEMFFQIQSSYNGYYNNQYPDTSDCITLDQQIKSIQDDIDDINKRKLSNKQEAPVSGFTNTYSLRGRAARDNSLNLLKGMLLEKQNNFDLGSCRNKIELQRQNESAAVFNQYAEKSDVQVIQPTNQKYLAYVVIGSAVLLTTLLFITRKKAT